MTHELEIEFVKINLKFSFFHNFSVYYYVDLKTMIQEIDYMNKLVFRIKILKIYNFS